MVNKALQVVETDYLTPQERIAIIRLDEIYESYKRDLDPNFEGISPTAWAKATKEVPESDEAFRKCWDIVDTILKSGRFGQVDWKL